MITPLRCFAIAVVLLCFVQSASASLITFTDRTAWRAAAGGGIGDITENFDAVSSDLDYASGNLQMVGDFSFVYGPGNSAVARVESSGGSGVNGTPFAYLRQVNANDTEVSFVGAPSGLMSFGFDFDDTPGFPGPLTLTTSFGDSVIVPAGSGFIGIVSSSPFSSIRTDTAGTTNVVMAFDNLEGFSAVPEPSSVFGICAMVCAALFRRNRRRVAG